MTMDTPLSAPPPANKVQSTIPAPMDTIQFPASVLLNGSTVTKDMLRAFTKPLISSTPPQAATFSRKICSMMLNGKQLSIAVMKAIPVSQNFAGYNLIQYRSKRPLGSCFEYRGLMQAENDREHLPRIFHGYALQIISLVKFIHNNQSRCSAARPEVCYICADISYLETDIWMLGNQLSNNERCGIDPSSLTSRLECILVGCYTRHCTSCRNCICVDGKHGLTTEIWNSSATNLLELCQLLEKPAFEKERKSWDPVIKAHLTIDYGYYSMKSSTKDDFLRTEEVSVRKQAMQDLQDGKFAELFVSTLEEECQVGGRVGRGVD